MEFSFLFSPVEFYPAVGPRQFLHVKHPPPPASPSHVAINININIDMEIDIDTDIDIFCHRFMANRFSISRSGGSFLTFFNRSADIPDSPTAQSNSRTSSFRINFSQLLSEPMENRMSHC